MKLYEYLEKNKITYAEFARMLGFSRKYAGMNILRYCTGERLPRPETAQKIIEITKKKVTLKDIYGVK